MECFSFYTPPRQVGTITKSQTSVQSTAWWLQQQIAEYAPHGRLHSGAMDRTNRDKHDLNAIITE